MEPVAGEVIALVEDVHFDQVFLLNGTAPDNAVDNDKTAGDASTPVASDYDHNHHRQSSTAGGGDDEEGCNAEGTWTGEATRLLLSTVEDLLPKVGTSPQLKTQTKMWAHVAQNIMKRHSYTFTAIQCQNRWKTLVRGYKRRIKTGGNPVSSGATLRTYHYYERKLEDILSKKSVLSAPRGNAEDAKLGEDCGVGDVKVSPLPGDTSSVASSTIEDEDDDAGVGRGCGGARGGRTTIALELRRLRWQRAQHHSRMAELADRRLTAYRERTVEIRRKNDLLEQFIRWTNKS